MPTIEFSSRQEANRVRDLPAARQHLAASDDRRTSTIKLKASTPRRVVERLRDESFRGQRTERASAGMAELSQAELKSIKRQHPNFNWQQHGFQAMRVKAAMKQQGVTEWMDHFDPGEGAASAMGKLRKSKKHASVTGARTGVEGMRTDEEELGGMGRRAKQAEAMAGRQLDKAKDAGLLELDPDAQAFLREEEGFGDVFDISFGRTDRFGRPDPTGQDVARLEEFHQRRSKRSQRQDERLAAPKTRDPIAWVNSPDTLDFPGIDTVDPEAVHGSRSKRTQNIDESRSAPLASSVAEWAEEPDQLDLPGVDTPMSDSGESAPALPSVDLADDPT